MNDIPESTQLPATDAPEAQLPVAPAAAASPVTEAAPAETPAGVDPAPESVAPVAPAAAAPADMSPAACAAQLKALFPALFSGPLKPLKLRVQADIQARAPGQFTKAQLSAFLRRYTGNTGYLIALGKATQRFDLDGQPAGELSEEHRAAAREELARRRGLQQERLAAEQAERDLAQTQRRNRAGLLHDFERTTLTLANFCVLKGVSPEELPGLLDLARAERAEAPPREAREPREGQGRRDGREGRGPHAGPRGARGEGRGEGRPAGRREGAGPRRGPGGQGGRAKPGAGR